MVPRSPSPEVTAVEDTRSSPARSRLVWWGLILAVVVASAYTWVAVVVPYLKPAFESVDSLDLTQVRGMTAFILNRPDGGPDIGHPKNPIVLAPGDYDKVLGTLRKAEPIDKERGVWLGQLTVKLADGRSQAILLHRTAPQADDPALLRFKIGEFQYEAGPVDRLVQVLVECEQRALDDPN
jgi:hypothetical protein